MDNKQIIESLIKVVENQQLILKKLVAAYQAKNFAKLGQYTVPLTNLPGKELHIDTNTGKPFYVGESTAPIAPGAIPPASLTGPSSITSSKPLSQSQTNPQPQTTQHQKMPPEWLKRYMYLEKAKEWADTEIQKMNDELAKMQAQKKS